MAKTSAQSVLQSEVRGRPKSSPLEKSRREALKAKRHLEDADSEFFERLALDDESGAERSEEVRQIADLRMKKAAAVNEARKLVSQARADEKSRAPGASARLKAAKAKEKKAYTEFRALPDLGFTQSEWDNPDMRKRELGRPQLDVEIKRVRAQEALKEAMAALKAEEKNAGEKHIPLAKLADPVKSSRGKGLGRPKLDRLGMLDRKLGYLEKKIEQIELETDHQDAANASGKGRKPKTKKAKLVEARKEAKDIKKMILAEEEKLDPIGRLNRTLKKLRDERRRMTLVIRDSPKNCEAEKVRHQYLGDTIDERLAELQMLEQEKGNASQEKRPQISAGAPVASVAPPEEAGLAPAGVMDNINANAAAARPAEQGSQAHMANVHKRRAEAMRQASEVDQKYAQWIDKLYEDFPEEAASVMAEPLERRRLEERRNIAGIDLIS